ncbi:hypothetical protein STEG23_011333, partial [Scotinomys teguina]
MARKAGQGKEEEESRARQQEEKTPVRHEEKKPACHGGGHHVVEQASKASPAADCSGVTVQKCLVVRMTGLSQPRLSKGDSLEFQFRHK